MNPKLCVPHLVLCVKSWRSLCHCSFLTAPIIITTTFHSTHPRIPTTNNARRCSSSQPCHLQCHISMAPPTTGGGQTEEDKHQQEEIRVLHAASMHGRTDVIKVGGNTKAGRNDERECERLRSRKAHIYTYCNCIHRSLFPSLPPFCPFRLLSPS